MPDSAWIPALSSLFGVHRAPQRCASRARRDYLSLRVLRLEDRRVLDAGLAGVIAPTDPTNVSPLVGEVEPPISPENAEASNVQQSNVQQSATVVPESVDPNGLIGRWRFTETQSDVAVDTSNNTNDGQYIGPLATSGRGTTLELSANDRVTVDDDPSLNVTGPISIAVWIKSDGLNRNSGGLISKSTETQKYGAAPDNATYEFGIRDGRLYFKISDGVTNSAVLGNDNPVIDGEWHHLTAVWDGTTDAGSLRIYIDGVETYTATSQIAAIRADSFSLDIGGGGGGIPLRGELDDVLIFERALRPGEILTLASNNPNAPDSEDPIIVIPPRPAVSAPVTTFSTVVLFGFFVQRSEAVEAAAPVLFTPEPVQSPADQPYVAVAQTNFQDAEQLRLRIFFRRVNDVTGKDREKEYELPVKDVREVLPIFRKQNFDDGHYRVYAEMPGVGSPRLLLDIRVSAGKIAPSEDNNSRGAADGDRRGQAAGSDLDEVTPGSTDATQNRVSEPLDESNAENGNVPTSAMAAGAWGAAFAARRAKASAPHGHQRLSRAARVLRNHFLNRRR